MDSFEINKIVACILVVALVFIGLANFSEILYHVEKPKVAAYQVEGAEEVVIGATMALAEESVPAEPAVSIQTLLASADIEKGAKVVEKTVAKTLNNEISQLKEDIDVARKNDFGRKIFETFAEEYNNSYMNEKSETAKLLKVVELKDKQLAEANANAEKKAKLVESKDAEIKNAVETAKRKETISELVAPLSKEQKEIMQDLLESVATDKLEGNFNKYLPAVIDGKSVAKKATLTEAKEITGDKEENSSSASNSAKVDNVVDIRRLAGLN